MSRSRLSLGMSGALGAALGLLAVAGPGPTPEAHACGCFAPPDPTTPIVQAGERILFAMDNGVVTAHIQIQYQGDAQDFAWLVPMPAVPTLELGTDELFTRIIQTTQPRYRLQAEFPDACGVPDNAGGGPPPPPPAPPPPSDSPVVVMDTIGPYEYAVLAADDQQAMLDWLAENRYFVPAGTDTAVTPYIRPGGYFLALKLQSGQSVGDLQPIVVKYASALPQIPIVLTSVAADPDMPVLVWVLGDHRAIPRNFFHTHINDALIDWPNNGANYIEVVTDAVDEADGHHSFITEYAGTSTIMVDVLDPPGRFGDLEVLRTSADPSVFLQYLWQNGFPVSSQVLAILERHLPMPPELITAVEQAEGYTPGPVELYFFYDTFLLNYPEILTGAFPMFDPAVAADELIERIVTPIRAAGQLFRDHPYLTRLFTTLSPDEMTKDPVFSFNPDLPEVSNVHQGQLRYLECTPEGYVDFSGPVVIVTEQGWELYLPNGLGANNDWPQAPLPASYRIEMLREEGAPDVVTENAGVIADGVDEYRAPPPPPREPGVRAGGGCAVGVGAAGGAGAGGLGALLLAGLALLRRRRA